MRAMVMIHTHAKVDVKGQSVQDKVNTTNKHKIG